MFAQRTPTLLQIYIKTTTLDMKDPATTTVRSPWWNLQPMTYVMGALAGWCAILGWIALHRQVTGSDPAGNGMATGFVQGFAEVGLYSTAILTGLYILVRWKPARYVCITLLLLLSLGMLLLVQ
jgi:hypothetical protein